MIMNVKMSFVIKYFIFFKNVRWNLCLSSAGITKYEALEKLKLSAAEFNATIAPSNGY